ncbi:TPA: DUF1737 domain-containing protein [Klebsiella pneumoniae]|uniref:DUF1737 domain-containing protein n=1 Tax=Klebsiella pneumoniae TaxID=573 RepID=UPI0021177EB2|nr:DUF1737 domain-containing protein [Klebsiella pneumoniae]MCQ8284431.1 DUF1737 domain-containing protein [Klebsiella pneumoniae]HEB5128382.1 DUF1737 domain-containing protein [Klebsiella pneumoniae]
MTYTGYKIVTGDNPSQLAEMVATAIIDGFQPLGAPLMQWGSFSMAQALVKGSTDGCDDATAGYSTPEMYGIEPSTSNVIGDKLDAMFAAGGNIKFEQPGVYLTNKTWILRSGTRLWLGDGVIIRLADGSNCNIFQNYAYNTNSSSPDESIEIAGSGTIDFNGANQTTGGLSSMATILKNITNLKIGGGIKVMNANKYAWLVCKITNFTADELFFDTLSDGLHCQPPVQNAYIRNLKGKTGDDMLAFTIGDYANYDISEPGDFSNVDVAGLFCDSALCAVKITGNSTGVFDNFRIAGIYGSTRHAVFRIWGDTNLLSTVVRGMTVEDVHALPAAGYPVFDIDDRNFASGTYGIEIDSLVLRNIYSAKSDEQTVRVSSTIGTMIHSLLLDSPPRDALTLVGLNHVSTTVEKLTVCNGNTVFVDNANSSVVLNRGTIKRLVIDNYNAEFPGTSNGSFVRLLGACTVNDAFFINTWQKNGTSSWINLNSAMAAPTNLNLVNHMCSGKLRIAQVLSSTLNIRLKNVSVENGAETMKLFYGKGGMITLSGDVDTPYSTIASDNGAVITTTKGMHNIPCDVSLLTPVDGASVYNTNAKLSCGAGMVIASEKVWKNLFSAATYSSAL